MRDFLVVLYAWMGEVAPSTGFPGNLITQSICEGFFFFKTFMIIWRGREESHSIGYSFPPRNPLLTFVLGPSLPEPLIYFYLCLSAPHHFLSPSWFSPCILYLSHFFIMQDYLLNILGYLSILSVLAFTPSYFHWAFLRNKCGFLHRAEF